MEQKDRDRKDKQGSGDDIKGMSNLKKEKREKEIKSK